MKIRFKSKDIEICQRHIYKITHNKKNYEVMMIFTEGAEDGEVHIQCYLMNYANALFLFEDDREGDLAEEDNCLLLGQKIVEDNFEAFSEALGF